MDKQLLNDLCQLHGVSNDEHEVTEFIKNQIKDYVDEMTVDALGNLIAHKKGKGKKMMLAGHMDQIGLIVTNILENGLIKFSNIGGINHHNLYYCRVVFKNGIVGVVANKHLDKHDTRKLSDMFIDIGFDKKADTEKHIAIGDYCTYCASTVIDDTKVITPALDDRIGCFIIIEALKQLKDCKYDLYCTFSVQEEVGSRGSKVASYAITPDYGIAFDVTTDNCNDDSFPQKMGLGACVKLKDSSVLCHKKIVSHLENVAKDNNIKYQKEILSAGGTDAGSMHLNKEGVLVGGISVATKHIHSTNEMCSVSDIEDCISLTVKMLETEIN